MLAAMSSLVWVELEAGAPDHNLRELRKCAAPEVMLCAVVKSNAYGHGLSEMVRLLPSAQWLGVNSLEEGVRVRELGETRPVLVMGHVPLADLGEAVARPPWPGFPPPAGCGGREPHRGARSACI
jgi:alanine racemase